MKHYFVKFIFLIYFLHTVASIETSTVCPLYTWQCKTGGNCINSEHLCDGNYDCSDGSDETVEECLLRPCPNYAFQCAYGACITGNFKCDGIKNCADGSDETEFLCKPKLNYEEEIQGKCTFPSSMQCHSGECISNERLCDGKVDCRDGSDETVEMCSFLKCPEYSFRCGYGACVTGLSVCNGFKDCRDGSDEIASICSNITTDGTTTTTARPGVYTTTAATTVSTTTTLRTTTTTSTEMSTDNYCSSSTLTRGISSVATCYYRKQEVSCTQGIRAGTNVVVNCAPGYINRHMKNNASRLQCDLDGEWTRPKTKCVPDCGVLTEKQKESTTKPWEVTVLRRDFMPIYEPICSGVIVSPKIVLTAGTCFLNSAGVYNTDHVFYNLIEGYYNTSYSSDYHDLNAMIHNISSISIKNIHRSQDLAVLVVVNYFQFHELVKPICLPTAQRNVFPFHADNKLNIGRAITRDPSKVFLEYIIANIEEKVNGRRSITYVDVYNYLPFINREIKKYDFIL